MTWLEENWEFICDKVYNNDGGYQFTHTFYRKNAITSDHFIHLEPIIEKFNLVSILRVKANLTTKDEKRITTSFHTDGQGSYGAREGEKGWLTSIFYLNTNNGYTVFEDGTKIESVANRLLTFPCSIMHAGVSQTDENIRVLINFNYII